jgi:chaperonin GroEL
VKGDNFDQNIGIQIVEKACKIPCKTICDNAGFEGYQIECFNIIIGAVVVDKLVEEGNKRRGFDAQEGEYVDMFKKGIIDPTKVIKLIISKT